MKATVTITSKRQVTIPRKLWDQLQLEGVRRLDAEVKNGNLVLRKDDYADSLKSLWNSHQEKICGEISDESIKRARRTAVKLRRL